MFELTRSNLLYYLEDFIDTSNISECVINQLIFVLEGQEITEANVMYELDEAINSYDKGEMNMFE